MHYDGGVGREVETTLESCLLYKGRLDVQADLIKELHASKILTNEQVARIIGAVNFKEE